MNTDSLRFPVDPILLRSTGSGKTLHSHSSTPPFLAMSLTNAPVLGAPGGTGEKESDPLNLVIEKRKRKELADPVIAEAILTACKLPPPKIPNMQDASDIPEEISQLIHFGLTRAETEVDNTNFFKTYPVHRKPLPPVKLITFKQQSLYEQLREKWASRLRPFSVRSSRDDEDIVDSNTEKRAILSQLRSEADGDDDWFMETVLHILCILMIIITLPLSLIFCLKVVAHYERAVLFRLGRLVSATAHGPGLIFVLPCLDRYRILDLRTFTFDVPPQEVLTKDTVTVIVNAVVYYRVRDPVRAVVNVEDANRATRVLGQTTLRNVLGTVNLDQVLTGREDIAALMQECLDSVTEAWGVKVERVEIKDVRLPIQLQRAMATEAESVREATAKVIAAEGERQASSALKAAASQIKEHPIAMQLRYLQAVSSISSGKESTIIFPVPLDILSLFYTPTTAQGGSFPAHANVTTVDNLLGLQTNTGEVDVSSPEESGTPQGTPLKACIHPFPTRLSESIKSETHSQDGEDISQIV